MPLESRQSGGQKYNSLSEEQRRPIFAEILPWLRRQVSQKNRFIGTIQDDDTIRHFANSNDAERLAELGTTGSHACKLEPEAAGK